MTNPLRVEILISHIFKAKEWYEDLENQI